MGMTEPHPIGEELDEASLAGRPVVARRRTGVAGDPAFRVVQLVWFLLGLVDGIIGLRVIFRAVAAHQVGFVSFIDALSAPLVAPFRGITADYVHRGTVVEVGSLIAMAIYLLAAHLVVKLVRIVSAPSPDGPTGVVTERRTVTYQ